MYKQEFVPSEIAILVQCHMTSLEVSFRMHAKSYWKPAFSKKHCYRVYTQLDRHDKKPPGGNLLMSNKETFTTLNRIHFHGFLFSLDTTEHNFDIF